MARFSETDEFGLIKKYFTPLSGPAGLGLKDDAACFPVPEGNDLVLSKDLLVAGTHFFESDRPADIAFKALSVNVSDLAAKGASLEGYLLGLALPKGTDEAWFEQFSQGLKDAQDTYGVALLGGDTTSGTSTLVVSVTALGSVPTGQMVLRGGARPGDAIYVTGTIGDGALGLLVLQRILPQSEYLSAAYLRPTARSETAMLIRKYASSAADVSDGLIADLGHICSASGVGAAVIQQAIPLSPDTRHHVERDQSLWNTVLSGGDDYEVLFTVPAKYAQEFEQAKAALPCKITRIGHIKTDAALEVVDSTGQIMQFDKQGYKHF